MEREGEGVRGGVERRLDSIAVVQVDVEVEDSANWVRSLYRWRSGFWRGGKLGRRRRRGARRRRWEFRRKAKLEDGEDYVLHVAEACSFATSAVMSEIISAKVSKSFSSDHRVANSPAASPSDRYVGSPIPQLPRRLYRCSGNKLNIFGEL